MLFHDKWLEVILIHTNYLNKSNVLPLAPATVIDVAIINIFQIQHDPLSFISDYFCLSVLQYWQKHTYIKCYSLKQ